MHCRKPGKLPETGRVTSQPQTEVTVLKNVEGKANCADEQTNILPEAVKAQGCAQK